MTLILTDDKEARAEKDDKKNKINLNSYGGRFFVKNLDSIQMK